LTRSVDLYKSVKDIFARLVVRGLVIVKLVIGSFVGLVAGSF
jgi:hypothetical protein